MTRTIQPIDPLRIPDQHLLSEAQGCAEAPVAPGLPPTRVFPGVAAWAVLSGGTAIAWALFVPEEFLTTGSDEQHRSGAGSLVTKAAASPVLDVRDVPSTNYFVIARAIRRALS